MLSVSKVIASLVLFFSFVNLSFAHTVKTDADVGVTFHIEPNHNPQARQATTAWFVLTRRGGQFIPLSDCDCQLRVYRSNSSEAVLTPSLESINAEQYQNIPGAEIVFPEGGIYQLEISGKPKQNHNFSPFKLVYEVTVLPGVVSGGKAPETEQAVTDQLELASNNYLRKLLILSVMMGGGAIAITRLRQRRSSS
jgi:hypothetical protein